MHAPHTLGNCGHSELSTFRWRSDWRSWHSYRTAFVTAGISGHFVQKKELLAPGKFVQAIGFAGQREFVLPNTGIVIGKEASSIDGTFVSTGSFRSE
jgi:hypothetical protein